MTSYLQVIGSGRPDSSPSLLLFFPHRRYAFNVGDGFQRYCSEHKIRLSKVDHFLFTSLSCKTLGGLSGLLLTISDIGVPSINLHGPPGLSSTVSSLKSFIHRPDFMINTSEFDVVDPYLSFQDDTITLYHVPCSKNSLLFIQTPDVYGQFDVAKAKSLGVPPGPLYSQLKKGQAVTVGGVEILPSEVVGSTERGSRLVIVDFDHADAIVSFLANSFISDHVDEFDDVTVVVHLVCRFKCRDLLKSPHYQRFVCLFPNATNILLYNSSSSPCPSSNALQGFLSCHFPGYFPQLSDSFALNADFVDPFINELRDYWKAKVEPGVGLLKILLKQSERKTKNCNILLSSFVPSIVSKINKLDLDEFDAISTTVKDHIVVNRGQLTGRSLSGGVLFLGTGSAIPSKYRNVSSTFIGYGDDVRRFIDGSASDLSDSFQSVLIDCGEGSFGQLYRLFGPDKIQRILASLSLVYITHDHADHNLGLWRLLYERNGIVTGGEIQCAPLLIIAPRGTVSVLQELEKIECLGKGENYLVIPHFELQDHRGLLESRRFSLKISPMDHHGNATAVTIQYSFSSDVSFKISHSGDGRPNSNFSENFAKKSDIFIHEATFGDDLIQEAVSKKHSTVSEALNMGILSQSSVILLSHFSQRYPRLVSTKNSVNFLPVMDYFYLPFDDLSFASLLYSFLEPVLIALEDD
ncbi:hypothetical protein P9112_002500 [Eukaryota sp. TZLM1-RC]